MKGVEGFMAKKNKSQQRKSNKPSVAEPQLSPVTEEDKWCLIKKPYDGGTINSEAPYGYVMTIPYIPSMYQNLGNVDGYVVRTKKHCGNFLLQIIPKETAREYGINSYATPTPSRRNKKKHSRIVHMLNSEKRKSTNK